MMMFNQVGEMPHQWIVAFFYICLTNIGKLVKLKNYRVILKTIYLFYWLDLNFKSHQETPITKTEQTEEDM